MDEFYLTLPSNASLDKFPDNSLTNYSTQLDRPLRLGGRWLVGMTEIHYPLSWNNLSDGYVVIGQKNVQSSAKLALLPGWYADPDILLREIHRLLMSVKLEKAIRLHYEKINTLFTFTVMEPDVTIRFSRDLQNVLGVDAAVYGQGLHKSKRPVDINAGFNALYIYTNIVDPQIVGDALAPLLRVVPIRSSERGYAGDSFRHVQYLPVSNVGTRVVDIHIRRDNGETVPFQSGKVVVTLHFKRNHAGSL